MARIADDDGMTGVAGGMPSSTWGAGIAGLASVFRLDERMTVTHACCPEACLLVCAPDEAVGRDVGDVLSRPIVRAIERVVTNLTVEQPVYLETGIVTEGGGTAHIRELMVVRLAPDSLIVVIRDFSEVVCSRMREEMYVHRLRDLAQEIERLADSERRNIAIELHDRVSQPLVAARMHLEQHARLHRATDVDERETHHERILGLIDEAIAESRLLTSELASAVYYELGLGPALKALTDEYGRRYGIDCTVDLATPPGLQVPDGIAAFIYRSARELLSNVHRHSGGGAATIRLVHDDGMLRLTVCDEGRGFELADVLGLDAEREGGFGLFSIHEHADRLGGDLTVQSQVSGGTCVVVDVPFPGRSL